MFTHHCTVCDRDQLIFASMVTRVAATDNGPELAFACWCGAEQTHLQQPEHAAMLAA